MTDPTDLKYCVRDRAGRIVVPWRPVGELARAAVRLDTAAKMLDYGEDEDYEPARANVAALLGLESLPREWDYEDEADR